jgi:hypothetical protein
MTSRGLKTVVQDKAHQRSASDIAQTVSSRSTTKKLRTWRLPSKRLSFEKGDTRTPTLPSEPSQPTTPKTADQAPSPRSFHSYLTLNLDFGSPIATPQIGEAKDIHVPVAAPIVMNLENAAQPRTSLSTPRAGLLLHPLPVDTVRVV